MFIVNVEGAIRRNDKWLIIKRSVHEEHAGGLLSLVGGKAEFEGAKSAVLEDTLKREIFEEVGITIADEMYYVMSTSFSTDKNEHVINIIYLCLSNENEPYCKSENEVEELFWLTTDEVLSNSNSPVYLKESIQNADKIYRAISLEESRY
ncbi:NUDIX domain-containing protein [Solibacillus sp. CAU 1738]|uniref:NUDIX hydrolase n=1 Tax=Solibacillus sp. CAU 1738 TaxID=3140363 RepID=UPI0032617E85